MFSNSRDVMNVIIEHYLVDGYYKITYGIATMRKGTYLVGFISSQFLRAKFISMLIRSIRDAMISHNSMWLFCSILCEHHYTCRSEFIPPSPHSSTTPYLHHPTPPSSHSYYPITPSSITPYLHHPIPTTPYLHYPIPPPPHTSITSSHTHTSLLCPHYSRSCHSTHTHRISP